MNYLGKFYIILIFFLFSLLMNPVYSSADVASVTVSPNSKNVQVGRSVSIPLVWTVVNDTGPVTVASISGEFRPAVGDPLLLGTVPKTLSKQVLSASGAALNFNESVLVPKSVLYRAHRLGLSSIVYMRTFDDGVSGDFGAITLHITGSGGAGFGISRISLRFDDDSIVRIISHGEKMHALADITFSGTGLVKALWEIADPSSTAGVPVYRPLRMVRQQLTASRKFTFSSPE